MPPNSDLVVTLIQLGGFGGILWFVLLRLEASLKGLTDEVKEQRITEARLLQQVVDENHNVAHEVHAQRETLAFRLDKIGDKIDEALRQ